MAFRLVRGKLRIEQVTISGSRKWAVDQIAAKFAMPEKLIQHGMMQKLSDAYRR
jgi:hypothetical protein